MNIKAATFDDYIRQVDPAAAGTVRAVLDMMRGHFPGAHEEVNWGIALFRREGVDLAGIAVRRGFYSVYLPHSDIMAAWLPRLGAVSAGKGCVRFKQLGDINTDEFAAMLDVVNRKAPGGAGGKR